MPRMTKIYTLVNSLGEWIVDTKPPTFTNESLAFPVASFVLDPLTGAELLPTAEALQAAMRDPAHSPTSSKSKNVEPHCLWIAVAKKSIRIAVNFNGERIGKVEFEEEEIAEAFYVTRHGMLFAPPKWHELMSRSKSTRGHHFDRYRLVLLPAFLGIHHTPRTILRSFTVSLPLTRRGFPSARSRTDFSRLVGKISMDDRSGDFVEHSGPIDINLRTLFHFRKALPPRLDPCSHRKAIPPQPLPVNYSTMGWLWGTGPISGVQLDALGECGFAILTFSSSLLARLRRHRWDHGVERPHNPTVFLTLSCR